MAKKQPTEQSFQVGQRISYVSDASDTGVITGVEMVLKTKRGYQGGQNGGQTQSVAYTPMYTIRWDKSAYVDETPYYGSELRTI